MRLCLSLSCVASSRAPNLQTSSSLMDELTKGTLHKARSDRRKQLKGKVREQWGKLTDDLEDYTALAGFVRSEPSAVTDDELETVRVGFAELHPEVVSDALSAGRPSDAAWVLGTAEDLAAASEALGIDLRDTILRLEEHAATLEGPEPGPDGQAKTQLFVRRNRWGRR